MEDIIPLLHVEWIGSDVHDLALAVMLAARRRDLSFADCVSFHTMRHLGLRHAFTVDKHFHEQGFECLPGAL